MFCDRTDYDGVSIEELERLKDTWEDIRPLADDWRTHTGICPSCKEIPS